jgi:hypothetical protein
MCPSNGGDHELSDAVSILNGEGAVAEVDEKHLYLSSIIAVDRARSVEAGDTVSKRKT